MNDPGFRTRVNRLKASLDKKRPKHIKTNWFCPCQKCTNTRKRAKREVINKMPYLKARLAKSDKKK